MKKHLHSSRRGQAISEYLILTALIAVASIAIVQVLGSNIQSRLAVISDALIGKKNNQAKGKESSKEQYEVRSLEDFNNAMEEK